MHGGGAGGDGGGLGGFSGGPVPGGRFPVGGEQNGPRRGRLFGDAGLLAGRRGTAILIGLLLVIVLLLLLTGIL